MRTVRTITLLMAVCVMFLWQNAYADTIGDVILQEGNAVIEQNGEEDGQEIEEQSDSDSLSNEERATAWLFFVHFKT